MNQSPKEQGRAAFAAGKRLEDNPFEVDSDDAFEWIDGWSEAETEEADGE
jgi:hypothetical protein